MTPQEWDDVARVVLRRQTLYHGPPRKGDGGSGEALEAALDRFSADALVAMLQDGVQMEWRRGTLTLDVRGEHHEVTIEPEDSYLEGFRVLNPPAPADAPRIVCLCMYGLVAGFMERFGVERALQRLGVEAAIEVAERAEWRPRMEGAAILVGQRPDEIRALLGWWDGAPLLVTLTDLLDEDEITDKLGAALRQLGYPTPGAPEPELPTGPNVTRALEWVDSLPREVWISS